MEFYEKQSTFLEKKTLNISEIIVFFWIFFPFRKNKSPNQTLANSGSIYCSKKRTS